MQLDELIPDINLASLHSLLQISKTEFSPGDLGFLGTLKNSLEKVSWVGAAAVIKSHMYIYVAQIRALSDVIPL